MRDLEQKNSVHDSGGVLELLVDELLVGLVEHVLDDRVVVVRGRRFGLPCFRLIIWHRRTNTHSKIGPNGHAARWRRRCTSVS